uniref:Nuclear protein MDM1 n=1 Tax=Daphnia magna TaxID=35525 RepID=A0A0N7ZQN3_9CRUS
MISSLWTLCQTCPSVTGKLDGKYRWTEYRDVPTAARVIEHAPQCSGHSVTESSTRVRKDGDDSQQDLTSGGVHDFMEPTLLAIPAHLKIDNQLYLQVLRRSQSEGPHQRSTLGGGGGVAAFEPGPMAAWVHGRRRHFTEQQRPEHWLVPAGAAAAGSSSALAAENRAGASSSFLQQQEHNHKRVVVVAGETTTNKRTITTGSSEYQLQFAWPPPSGKNIANNSNCSSAFTNARRMPESLDSLLNHSHDGEREAAGLLSNSRINNGTGTTTRSQEMVYHAAEELLLNHQEQNELSDDQPRRRRYKTEYKKKFRPFSLYQYVDGRFQKSSSDKIQTSSSTVDGGPATAPPLQSDGIKMDKDTWYGEVLELRKKAGEYKYRGLGGELMSDHMADLYAKQMDVWEQVSRRSSLSALALAATTPRPGSEKVEMTSAANSKRGSPVKTASPQNSSTRPGHAQPLVSSSRNKDNNARNKGSDSVERARRDMSQHRSVSSEGSKSRSKSAKPAKSPAQQNGNGNVTLAIRPSLGAIFHPISRPPARSASLGPERRMPKSASSNTTGGTIGSSTTKTSPVKARPAHTNEDGVQPIVVKKNQKVSIIAGEGKENIIVDEPANSLPVIEQEPLPALIKALPEPTRVKSPEQLVIRSPDPVNWTVPLDTGKTFTVTQNIRGGEGSRPHSELKVSMTVRPLPTPAAPVHSVLTPIVSVITKQPIQQQQEAPLSGAPDESADVTASSNETEETNKMADAEVIEDLPAEEHPVDDAPPVDEVPPADDVPAVTALETKMMEVPVKEMEEDQSDCKPEEIQAQKEEEKKEENQEREEEVKVEKEEEEKVTEKIKEIESLPEKQQEQTGPVSDPLDTAVVLGKAPLIEDLPAVVPVESVTSIVPGTTLRRLEDPTPFLFSRPGTLGSLTASQSFAGTSLPDVKPKAPRYRVLEAPGMMSDPVVAHPKVHELSKPFQNPKSEPYEQMAHPLQSSTAPMMTSSSPYKGRVLEAPSSPPKSSAVSSSPSDSQISSRSLASDVLEKARTRFDRFWTKKESDK